MTDKATPRLFLGAASSDFGIYDEKGEPIFDCVGSREFAALIVRAVNSFDEREALLREALDYVDDCALGRRSGEGRIEREAASEIAARIRTALGET